MFKSLRAMAVVSLACATLLAGSTAHAKRNPAISYAGTWQYAATVHCANRSGLNAIICAIKLGYQTSASTWASLVSNAAGDFSFSAVYIVAEDTAKTKPLCNQHLLTTKFDGTCYITSQGTGVVGRGLTQQLTSSSNPKP